MLSPHAKTARLAGAILVGGLAAGALVAMTVPTRMQHDAGGLREAIGNPDIADGGGAIPVYTPPEDMSPNDTAMVSWQTAAQEYAMAPAQDPWVDPSADVAPELIDPPLPDYGDDGASSIQLTRVSASRRDQPAADDHDAAAVSAQAAEAAAADVRAAVASAAEAPDAASTSGKT